MNAEKELRTAYRLRHALDERSNDLPPATCERLAAARHTALSRKKAETEVAQYAVQAGMPRLRLPSVGSPRAWFGRLGMVLPLAALVFGLIGIYQHERRQQIIATAELDAEVLTDELPISAWLDHGFEAFVSREGQD